MFSQKSEAGQGLNLFYCTDEKVCCYQDLSKKKDLHISSGGNLFDINRRGNLIGCPRDDNKMVYEFNT